VLGEWEGENAPECVGTKTEVEFDRPQAELQTVVDLPCRLGQRIAVLGSFQNE
jgi:hypothetical protein